MSMSLPHKAMVVSGLLLFVAGCAGAGQNSALMKAISGEAESYAQSVFEQQNRVLMAITQFSGDPSLTDLEQDQFYNLEDRVNAACAPLQEAAFRTMNGEELDAGLQLEAFNSLEGCERASALVEVELLDSRPDAAQVLSSL